MNDGCHLAESCLCKVKEKGKLWRAYWPKKQRQEAKINGDLWISVMSTPSRPILEVFNKIYHVYFLLRNKKRCRYPHTVELEAQCIYYLLCITIHNPNYICVCCSWIQSWLVSAGRLFWSWLVLLRCLGPARCSLIWDGHDWAVGESQLCAMYLFPFSRLAQACSQVDVELEEP